MKEYYFNFMYLHHYIKTIIEHSMRVLLLVAITTLSVMSCQNETPSVKGNVEDFEQFHDKFLTDSLFQMSRIAFPLQGAKSTFLPDSLKTNFWVEEEWNMHRKVEGLKDYEHKIIQQEDIVVEVFYDEIGGGIQKNYMAIDGKWQLVYYSDYNKFEPGFLRNIQGN